MNRTALISLIFVHKLVRLVIALGNFTKTAIYQF